MKELNVNPKFKWITAAVYVLAVVVVILDVFVWRP